MIQSPTAYYSVQRIFRDNSKINVILDENAVHGGKLEARPESTFSTMYNDCEIITVGHCNKQIPLEMRIWDQSMYKQAGVNFEESWKFSYPREESEEIELENHYNQCTVFLHDDPTKKRLISKDIKGSIGDYIYPDRNFTDVITNYTKLLQRCTEIHCIPSSFSCFIDRIELPLNPILNLHVYARSKSVLPTYKKNWNYIY